MIDPVAITAAIKMAMPKTLTDTAKQPAHYQIESIMKNILLSTVERERDRQIHQNVVQLCSIQTVNEVAKAKLLRSKVNQFTT